MGFSFNLSWGVMQGYALQSVLTRHVILSERSESKYLTFRQESVTKGDNSHEIQIFHFFLGVLAPLHVILSEKILKEFCSRRILDLTEDEVFVVGQMSISFHFLKESVRRRPNLVILHPSCNIQLLTSHFSLLTSSLLI